MLDQIIAENWLTARALYGFFPANRAGDDDITLYTDDTRSQALTTLHHLRQQTERPAAPKQAAACCTAHAHPEKHLYNHCLADYIAPQGHADYLGSFAVTTGIGIETQLARFEAEHDDYNSIMLKALADRLAEAFAEHLHQLVRKELWGYAPDETLDNDALIAEHYRGIRPAPGYPACPDHTEKALLWELLKPTENIGLSLTDSYAMYPAAAVSGWYFSHPEAKYFGIGKIDQEQVEDYAVRKGMDVEEMERWLAPVIG